MIDMGDMDWGGREGQGLCALRTSAEIPDHKSWD